MAHRPARRAAGSRRIARQAAGEDQGHARARQFSSGILQAGSPETKYQLSAHDPEPGAFLRSISHLTNKDPKVHVELERCGADDRIGQPQTLFSSELYRAGTDRQSQFTDHKLTQKFADLLFFFGCQGWPN